MQINETGVGALILPDKYGLLIAAVGEKKIVKLPALTLTRTGRDFYELGQFADPPVDYIQKLADTIKTDGIRVELGAKAVEPNGTISVIGFKEL